MKEWFSGFFEWSAGLVIIICAAHHGFFFIVFNSRCKSRSRSGPTLLEEVMANNVDLAIELENLSYIIRE